MRNCKKGFTLAEVLITLVIIGAVASLTIPDLINNIGDQQNRVAWKKAFSDISQATMRIAADNGGSLKDICSILSHDCLKRLYFPYLNYVKTCSVGNSAGICWHNNNSFKTLSGTPTDWGNPSGLILNNGNLVEFWHSSPDCSSSDGLIKQCGYMAIDVNGFTNPNTIGKDIFLIHILESSIKPYGTQGDWWPASTFCTASGSGQGCSAQYLYQ